MSKYKLNENDIEAVQEGTPLPEEIKETKICQAIIDKNTEEFRRIIFSGAKINEKSGSRQVSPLYLAAERGESSMIMLLLACGANIEEAIEGMTPLAIACLKGHSQATELLVVSGANTECEINDQPLILFASQRGNHKLLKLISKIGPSDKDADKAAKLPSILLYSKVNDFKAVKHLIEIYGNEIVNSSGPDNITALHHCALHKDIKLASLLISKGAKINALTNQNETPIHWAAKMGNLALVTILVRREADIEIKSKAGKTPFMNSCENGHKDVAQFLIGTADINYQSPTKGNALHIAAKLGNIEILDLFTETQPEFDIMQKGPDGKTALEIATYHGRTLFLNKMIDILDKKGLLQDAIKELKTTKVNCTCYLIAVLNIEEEGVTKGRFEAIVSGLSFQDYIKRYKEAKRSFIAPGAKIFDKVISIKQFSELEALLQKRFTEKENELLTEDQKLGRGLGHNEVAHYRFYLDPPSIRISQKVNPGLMDLRKIPKKLTSPRSTESLNPDQRAAGSHNSGR